MLNAWVTKTFLTGDCVLFDGAEGPHAENAQKIGKRSQGRNIKGDRMLRLIVRFTYLFMRLSAIKPLDGLAIVLTGERLQRKKKTYHSKGNLLANPPTFNVGKDANRIALFKQPLLCQHSISRRHPGPNNECEPLPIIRKSAYYRG